jgi:hypothetical protein
MDAREDFCLCKRQDGYKAAAVPPSLTIFNDREDYRVTQGWGKALDDCPAMPAARRDHLKREMRHLIDSPYAHAEKIGTIQVRSPRWL